METIETQIEAGLQILDQKEAELTQLSQQFIGLTINGLEDRAGFKVVREGRITMKNARVGVEKAGKALRENAVKFSKRVIEREKQLIAIISPTELFLQQQEENYLALLEEARVKKDREENERIQKRVDALAKFDYAIDLYELKIMEEENFQVILGHAEAEFQKEQLRKAEEAAYMQAEKEAEEKRVANERAELAKQKAEQEARERELQRQENERIEETRKRDAEFKAEQERIKRDQEGRENALRAEREKLEKEKREHEEKIRIELAKKEAAERAVIEEQARVKREQEAKIEAEHQAKIKAEREEALKPDKEKLRQYLNNMAGVIAPTLVDPKAISLCEDMIDDLQTVANDYKNRIHLL